jgi:hypothetical protein
MKNNNYYLKNNHNYNEIYNYYLKNNHKNNHNMKDNTS